MLRDHKDLVVWQRSIELVESVYEITNCFPISELYGLSSQMKRASISVPSNIAEGYKREGTKEYLRFLNIAESSLVELETQIIISKKLYNEVDYSRVEDMLLQVQKMLFVLMKRLKD